MAERSIAAQKRGTETRFPALRGLRSGDTIELLSTSDLWRKRVLFALAADFLARSALPRGDNWFI